MKWARGNSTACMARQMVPFYLLTVVGLAAFALTWSSVFFQYSSAAVRYVR